MHETRLEVTSNPQPAKAQDVLVSVLSRRVARPAVHVVDITGREGRQQAMSCLGAGRFAPQKESTACGRKKMGRLGEYQRTTVARCSMKPGGRPRARRRQPERQGIMPGYEEGWKRVIEDFSVEVVVRSC